MLIVSRRRFGVMEDLGVVMCDHEYSCEDLWICTIRLRMLLCEVMDIYYETNKYKEVDYHINGFE